MHPAELHKVRDGINAGDVDALVDLYEPGAVLMADGGVWKYVVDNPYAAPVSNA